MSNDLYFDQKQYLAGAARQIPLQPWSQAHSEQFRYEVHRDPGWTGWYFGAVYLEATFELAVNMLIQMQGEEP